MSEKIFEVNKEKLLEVNGRFCVKESDLNKIIGKKEYYPIYFVKLVKTKILHDSPAIGAWEYGQRTSKVDGPYHSLDKAQAAIEEAKEKIDHISYEFGSKIISRLLDRRPEPDMKVYKYYREYFEVFSADLAVLRGGVIYPQRYASTEKVNKFSDIIIERLKSKTSNYKEENNKLKAVFENCFSPYKTRILL